MTDTQYLEKVITECGKKKGYLADKLGISRQSFYNKMTNVTRFNLKEVQILCSELNITKLSVMNDIFLRMIVTNKSQERGLYVRKEANTM